VSRLVTPSTVMFLASLRPPLTKMLPMLVGPGASRPSLVSTTPGSRLIASKISRPRKARFSSWSLVRGPLFSPLARLTEATSALTVTASVTSPICKGMRPRDRCWPDPISIPVCTYRLNPGVSTDRVNVAGVRSGKEKKPSLVVVALRTNPLPSPVSETRTPAIAAPPGSRTVPESAQAIFWAGSTAVRRTRRSRARNGPLLRPPVSNETHSVDYGIDSFIVGASLRRAYQFSRTRAGNRSACRSHRPHHGGVGESHGSHSG